MLYPLVIHEQHREFIYPAERNKLVVRAKVERGSIQYCTLIYFDSLILPKKNFNRLVMECYAQDNIYDYYECEVTSEKTVCYLNYFFEVNDGKDVFWVDYYGIKTSIPASDFFKYQYANEADILRVPAWVNEAIIYQIFPERFFNGDTANDPENTEKWGSEPTRANFMGGDLRGIIKKINYIKSLGINTIYLNPVFESPSNHKYDTTDYYSIDRHFGNVDDLKELTSVCHENGIRVILDGVFNHCGYDFDKFRDVLENGPESEYKDWFYINEFPIDPERLNYECFGYYHRMPKLRLGNPDVRKYILGFVQYWMEEVNIDGWRLDVADEVDYTFWQEFRKLAKRLNPDCFLIAETWKENSDMLKGDQFDSVMNYLFREAVVNFFGKAGISSYEFNARLNRFIGVYQKQTVESLYNLIGSHDTERFLNVCDGDIRKMKAAVAFQFCFTGIPSIYYGDEIGITGDNDPLCRKSMEWDEEKQNLKLLEFYRKLIKIRKASRVMTKGGFRCNYCSPLNNVYGFFRFLENERVYIVINNADTCNAVTLPVIESQSDTEYMLDMLNEDKYYLRLTDNEDFFYKKVVTVYNGSIDIELEPYQVCILVRQK